MHADVHLCLYRTPRVIGQDEIHPLPSVFALPQFLDFAVDPYLTSGDPIEALHETPDGHVAEGISEKVEIHVYGGAAHRIGDSTHDHAALDRHLVVEAGVLDGLEDYVVCDLGIPLPQTECSSLRKLYSFHRFFLFRMSESFTIGFASMTECEDFMTMIHDFDEKTTEMFKGEAIPTLGGWLRLGKRFTDAMRDGSSVPTKYASELADTKRDIANATYPP